jgi:hypothetical protein
MTDAVLVLPSLVAVIFAVPAATPVTRPEALTVATDGAPETQVNVRPVSVVFPASFAVAVICCVLPIGTLALVGLSVTVATEGIVITAAALVMVSLLAVMFAVPTAIAVTSPELFTEATEGASEDHVTTRPASMLLLASFSVDVIVTCPPICNVAPVGLTVTVATGIGSTVMLAVPLLPSLVAVIVAVPVSTAVTSPVTSTLATSALLVDHCTVRPVNRLPLPSLVVAARDCVWPLTIDADDGATITVATGTGVTTTDAVPT